jgi:predicted nucleotidyltransferase component of viral defense system
MTRSLLSTHQIDFLEFVGKQPQLHGIFYLSGGTALSEFYLRHRFSEDLDFFSEKEFDAAALNLFLLTRKEDFSARSLQYQQSFNRNLFFLEFADQSSLKVEFTLYPFTRLEKGPMLGNLQVDSVLDIAVNKAFLLTQQARGRDYVDIFEIHRKYAFDFKELLKLARVKFDYPINILQLGKNLVKVTTFQDDPILLKNINKTSIEDYFLQLAKELDIIR